MVLECTPCYFLLPESNLFTLAIAEKNKFSTRNASSLLMQSCWHKGCDLVETKEEALNLEWEVSMERAIQNAYINAYVNAYVNAYSTTDGVRVPEARRENVSEISKNAEANDRNLTHWTQT
jgi:hypothetical protein